MSGPRIGELFAGYGGLGMGVKAVLGGEVAWVSEIDKGACKVLDHRFPDVPNHGDISAIDWSQVEPVDILTGGFPCQDVSSAGKRAGIRPGTRSGLWAQFAYAIDQLRPRLVVIENVRGLLSAEAHSDVEPCAWCVGDDTDGALRALGAVLGDLADLGYDASWYGLPAADVGAPHGRFRVFIVACPASNPWGFGHGDGGPAPITTNLGHERRRPARDGWAGPTDGGLLSTPRATDGDLMLPSAVALLPTPVAQEPGGTPEQYHARFKDGRDPTFVPLSMAVGLLHGQTQWGDYTAAIARWEHTLGRPAPAPTQTSAKGNPQLAPAFVEWMMGLPAGWVTDVPGITRNEALKLCGNGVVPQQAEAALRVLLDRMAVAA